MTEWFADGLSYVFDVSNTLNASMAASWLILVVLFTRLLLKKAPRWLVTALWGIVALRLLMPGFMESPLSLLPSAQLISPELLQAGPVEGQEPAYLEVINNSVFDAPVTVELNRSIESVQWDILLFTLPWLIGMAVMAGYALISWWMLHRKVLTAVRLRDNIFQSEHIPSPFVMGIFRPRIYLPFQLQERDMDHVIAHEQAHIRRLDHWWKPLGFFLLAIHWFNPLMWLACVLLCRDLELACDEKVIKDLDREQRADYTQALVACSIGRPIPAACPVSFGEIGVKTRVRSVLHYRKPAVWLVAVALLLCVMIAVCFLTDPSSRNTTLMGANYTMKPIYSSIPVEEPHVPMPLQYCVSADYRLYYQLNQSADWTCLGPLVPYGLSNEELGGYLPDRKLASEFKIGKITDAYILRIEQDFFYLVFQTKRGETYLAYGWEDVAERGQEGSDDTSLRLFCQLKNPFRVGGMNANFLERSLRGVVGNQVYCFASFESDDIPGYHIAGFKSGPSIDHREMTDMGYAVFQTNGTGYRLIDFHVYENAALAENGIYFCSDPAVADVHGQMRDDNTYDVILICSENVGKIEQVYRAEGKEDWIQSDEVLGSCYMSLWPWSFAKGYDRISRYCYDKEGNFLPASGMIPE